MKPSLVSLVSVRLLMNWRMGIGGSSMAILLLPLRTPGKSEESMAITLSLKVLGKILVRSPAVAMQCSQGLMGGGGMGYPDNVEDYN